ncbi:MAG TPA: LuxR family transcriptional regulator [Trebonia sp.]
MVETSPNTEQRTGLTDFIGRKPELAALASLLGNSRLVTVAGPGGVGKTRVALVAAAAAIEAYADGVWIVELSGLRDPELLPNTVASVLRLPEGAPQSQLATVLEYLRDQTMLLIFDTCEHLIDACASLAEQVLQAAPGVTILATSRQPLDAPGEHVYVVPPLPVPDPEDEAPPPPGLPGDGAGDAVELFALRAASVVPGFEVTTANWANVIRLCRRLDGIPLAIELAAVRLQAMTLPDLTRQLDRTFQILTSEGTIPLGRHETLRAAIEWSHHLCSPAERRLWSRLSAFAGTFDVPAVEEVCAETELERDNVVSALVGLVDKSVVLRDPDDDRRYLLLDTIREYGAEQLKAAGEVTGCRDRHLTRYARLARELDAHFTDDEQMPRYRQLRREHADIRAALKYALDSTAPGSRVGLGADLANGLWGYWQISGLLREGAWWLTKVLDQFPDPSLERARALANRGFLRAFHGSIPESVDDSQAASAIADALGEDAISGRAHLHLALGLTFKGIHHEAAVADGTAERLLAACGDQVGLKLLMAQTGHLYQLDGDLDKAIDTCARGLDMLGGGERWSQSYLLHVSGVALFRKGRVAESKRYMLRALDSKREIGDLIGTAYALDTLGWLAAGESEYSLAAWLLGAASPLWERGASRFSGTAIMEEFHQQAVCAAQEALGPERYDSCHAAGARHVKEQVAATAHGRTLSLRIPDDLD